MRILCLFPLLMALVCSPVQAATEAELDQMIGQMILVGFRGMTITPDSPIAKDLAAGRVGGVVLFNYDVILKSYQRNILNSTQLINLVNDLKRRSSTPLFVAVHQEGGRVALFRSGNGFADFPSAESMGKNGPDAARFVGREMGRMLKEVGVNVNFAPVVDLNDNPTNPVIGAVGRSFSASPARVAACAGAFLDAMQQEGVLGCLKHFPGHGSSSQDSHRGMADISATWREMALEPYEMLMRKKGRVKLVMTGHLFNSHLDPNHPATLSQAILIGILRDRLGFEGVIFTDDMQMRAITTNYGLERAIELAVLAGVDVLTFGNNLEYDPDIALKAHTILKKLVAEGKISPERIQESAERIRTVKKSLQ